jgi:hypothetical protein
MRTVYDLLRAEGALLVECRNCGRSAKVSALLMRDRLGLYGRLDDARWRCTGCGDRNARVTIGAASLAEPPARRYQGIR